MTRARASIVGGNQIAITQAPWQTLVVAQIPKPEKMILVLLCGGSVIDETHIVTAGHCMFDPTTGLRVPAEELLVVAGTSNFANVEPGEQETVVASVRVHPDFEYGQGAGTPDDVAVLTLIKGLTFSALVQPIGLGGAGSDTEEGTHVNLTGFGRETPTGSSEGPLHSLGMTVGFSRPCGGPADAVFICASTTEGSGCNGDSGSGLTGGSSPVLLGVMDTVEIISGEACREGADNGFVNITAPEIHDFIEGSETPPQAPRGGGAIVSAVTRVGEVVTCEPGSWTGTPIFAYAFVNSSNGQLLQSGPSAIYRLTAGDAGRTIYCQVSASNAGGTGVGRTPALRAIEALPPPSPAPKTPGASPQFPTEASSPGQTLTTPSLPSTLSLTGANLATQRDGSVLIKLDCEGEESCSGDLKLQSEQTAKTKRGKKASHAATIGHGSFSIAANQITNVTLHLTGSGLAMLRAAHGRLIARLRIGQALPGATETLVVHLIAPALHSVSKRKK